MALDIKLADVKDFVRKIAPTVATAIGGPLAGGVVASLSQILLGKPDGTEGEMATAIAQGQLTGEQIVQIKQLEMQLKKDEQDNGFRYADLEFQREKMLIDDVQNARAREIAVNDNMPQIIMGIAFFLYILQIGLFYFGQMPEEEFTRALVVRAFGTIDGVLLTCVAYFVGSSKGSKNSGDTTRRIAEQQATSLGKLAEQKNTVLDDATKVTISK